jgi:hypothetical protein
MHAQIRSPSVRLLLVRSSRQRRAFEEGDDAAVTASFARNRGYKPGRMMAAPQR